VLALVRFLKTKRIMKNELLDSINEIHEEMKSLTRAGSCGEYAGCAEYEDTKGIVDSVLKSPIVGNLLFLFWQRTSDACPLECTEAEKQETEFKEWVKNIDFDLLIKGNKKFTKCLGCNFIACENHETCLKDKV
jgi:hypothetical protein